MKINTDHVDGHPTLEVVTSLRADGYAVDVTETRVCPSSSTEEVYYLQNIETTEEAYPADIVESQTSAWVCSCPNFLFQHSPVTKNGPNTVGEMGQCKHIISEVRTEKAKADDKQSTL